MERGQASLEYVAVVAVLCALLAAGIALAHGTAEAVPRAVVAGVHRALCLVTGGDCLEGAPRPCVTSSDARAEERRALVVAVRLGDGRTVVREQRSDGTVLVSELDSSSAGAALTGGLQVQLGRRSVKASVEGGADVRAGAGRRWVLPDASAADRLLARLSHDGPRLAGGVRALASFVRDGDPQGADERFFELGAGADVAAALALLGLGARAEALRGLADGVRVNRRTGERTIFLRVQDDLAGALSGPLGKATATARAGDELGLELTFDAHGSAQTLVVRSVRAVRGTATLGPYRSGGGDRVEAEARLDLADPGTRTLADALVSHPSLGAAKVLAARIADRARIDVRAYATTHDEDRNGVSVKLIGGVGVEDVKTVDTARLVAAAGREPGLGWSRRLDCVLAA